MGSQVSSDLQNLKALAHLASNSPLVKVSEDGIHRLHYHTHAQAKAHKKQNSPKDHGTEHTHDLAAQPTFDTVLLAPASFSKLEVVSPAQDYSEALPSETNLKSIFRPPIA